MPKTTLTSAPDGTLRDDSGRLKSTFVDSCRVLELVFPTTSIIGFRLWDSSEHPGGEGIAPDQPNQFHISSTQARKLAAELIAVADEIERRDPPDAQH